MKISLRNLAIGAALMLGAGSMQATEWQLSSEVPSWNSKDMTTTYEADGKGTATIHVDVLYSQFEFNKKNNWDYEYSYINEDGSSKTIDGFGTYTFTRAGANCNKAVLTNLLYNVDVTIKWDTADESKIEVELKEVKPEVPKFQLSGHQPAPNWLSVDMDQTVADDGVVTATVHRPVLYSSFEINSTDWNYEYSYINEDKTSKTIPSFGTYDFDLAGKDCNKALLNEPLYDVDIIVKWNPANVNKIEVELKSAAPQFQFSGHQPGWMNENMEQTVDANGIVTAKIHRDVLYSSFEFNTTNWAYEYSYPTEISGFGTYEFVKFPGGDEPKAQLKEPLENVDITIKWNPAEKDKLLVTLADASTNGVQGVAVENAEAEYYRLDGIRVAADSLTPGLYIRRQGSNTTKVYIR